jgi:hypothetical protein
MGLIPVKMKAVEPNSTRQFNSGRLAAKVMIMIMNCSSADLQQHSKEEE